MRLQLGARERTIETTLVTLLDFWSLGLAQKIPRGLVSFRPRQQGGHGHTLAPGQTCRIGRRRPDRHGIQHGMRARTGLHQNTRHVHVSPRNAESQDRRAGGIRFAHIRLLRNEKLHRVWVHIKCKFQ